MTFYPLRINVFHLELLAAFFTHSRAVVVVVVAAAAVSATLATRRFPRTLLGIRSLLIERNINFHMIAIHFKLTNGKSATLSNVLQNRSKMFGQGKLVAKICL